MEGNQQSEIKKLRYEETRQPLVRYVKNPLVKYAKMQVVYSVLILALMALLMFTPMFSVNILSLESVVNVETLPKFSSLTSDYTFSFSIFDELKLMYSSFNSMCNISAATSIISLIFQQLALCGFILAAVMAIITLVKNLVRSSYSSSKYSVYNYTLNDYGEAVLDEIMYTPKNKKDTAKRVLLNPLFLAFVAIFLEIVCLIMFGAINSSLEEMIINGEASAAATSYMSYMNSANIWLAVVIIIAVLAIGLFIYTQNLKFGMKERIAVMESEKSRE